MELLFFFFVACLMRTFSKGGRAGSGPTDGQSEKRSELGRREREGEKQKLIKVPR